MPSKMSTSSQNNGKKSSNSSIVNTPSSTPITNIANGSTQVTTQSSPPPNNAPKYGTLVPNRIFVGGISANTTEGELMQLFSNYGTVKAAKIIQDRAGVSRGYGFITFESEDDAKRPLREAENIVLRERKLNIAPAIKKQPFSRAFDASSPPTVTAGNPAQFFFPPGAAMPYFQGGVAYYPQPAPPAPGDPSAQQPVYQPPPMYPTQTGPPQTAAYPSMMFPTQTIYMPQQYPMPMPYEYNFYQGNGGAPTAQYMAGAQSGSGGPQCTPMPPSNSPPRAPCYSQQMPAYNTGDPMFYNLPVYGATLEGPPIYTEAFELGTTGPYTEDSYNHLDSTLTQDVETSQQGGHPSAPIPVQLPIVPTSDPNRHMSAPHPHAPPAVSDANIGGGKPHMHHQQPTEVNVNERNSQTPVVSLLSIDHQQEKDYSSMQRGRRRKTLTQNTHNMQVYPTANGFVPNQFVGFNPLQPPPFDGYNNGYPTGFNDYRRVNGYDNRLNNVNRPKRRVYENNRRLNDHSSRSSLRTDSNSSASCVDENKNEERAIRTAVNTPPPAPYSPITHHQFKIISNSNAKNYYNTKYNNNNSYRPTGAAQDRSQVTNDVTTTKNKNGSNSNNNASTNTNSNPNTNSNSNPNSNSNSVPNCSSPSTNVSSSNSSTLSCPNSPQSLNNSQVHLSTTTSQSFVPQAARRNKRSLRRNGGAGVNEIGAGDAPLPGEVGEVCKKLETLKL